MLEIRKTAVSFDEGDLMVLERIVMYSDGKEALRFVKKVIESHGLNSQDGVTVCGQTRLGEGLLKGTENLRKDYIQR